MPKPKTKKIIITVDDFGYNDPANQLIFETIEKGIIHQASTIVNMGGAEKALAYIAVSSPKLRNLKSPTRFPSPPSCFKIKFGLHLNLTEGEPLCHPKIVPSLVDKNGWFLGWPGLIKRALSNQLRSQDIKNEVRAQIEKFQTIIKPSPFLNSHHHIHL